MDTVPCWGKLKRARERHYSRKFLNKRAGGTMTCSHLSGRAPIPCWTNAAFAFLFLGGFLFCPPAVHLIVEKTRFMPLQLREIEFHVENHATQWHGFQHEIQFQEIVVAWIQLTLDCFRRLLVPFLRFGMVQSSCSMMPFGGFSTREVEGLCPFTL